MNTTVDSLNAVFDTIPETCIVEFLREAGFFYLRESSGQGKVREIPDWAKVREKSGNFVEGQGKNEYWEKSGNLHLVQSK